ncbi:hypothetical protein EG329_007907 [Mollisiaceae sp. DMI_Dod_QoI]|nr:hypothetical protein EG329_007907 [Helotiales sp. DMI_Dod_QoI]
MESKKSLSDALLVSPSIPQPPNKNAREHIEWAPMAHLSSQTTESLSKNDSNMESDTSTTSKTRLTDLPYDIILEIFELSGICMATCLGLTCHQLYAFLKIYHGKPIYLMYRSCQGIHPWQPDCESWGYCRKRLHTILERSEIMRGYRLEFMARGWQFLNTKIYGETPNNTCCSNGLEDCHHEDHFRERRLIERYGDMKHSHGCWNLLSPGEIAHLPNPRNLGEDWYDQAWKIVASSVGHFNRHRNFCKYWKKFCFVKQSTGHDKVYDRLYSILDESLWDMWSEGLKLLDI